MYTRAFIHIYIYVYKSISVFEKALRKNVKNKWRNCEGLSFYFNFVVVCCLIASSSLQTSVIAACQASLPITNSWSFLKLMSMESVVPGNHLILGRPLLLQPSNLSQHQGLFQGVGSSHQVAKVVELQLQHQKRFFFN